MKIRRTHIATDVMAKTKCSTWLCVRLSFYRNYSYNPPFPWIAFLLKYNEELRTWTSSKFLYLSYFSVNSYFILIELSLKSLISCEAHTPHKHTTWILRWNDVETTVHVVSTWNPRGVCRAALYTSMGVLFPRLSLCWFDGSS